MEQGELTRRGWGIAVAAVLVALALSLGGGHTSPAAAQSSPQCPWMNSSLSPDQRAGRLVAAMSLDQEVAMVHQAAPIFGYFGTAGYIPGQPGLCIPDLVLNDAGQGVGDEQVNTVAFPAGKAQASTWDPALVRRLGDAVGWEAWHKGIDVMLAPGIEIDRVPRNGRNFEYLSEDPFLSGKGGAAYVRGLQSEHVIATIKHYVANSQETNRMSDSADVDDRTLHEIYAAPYETAIRDGHPGSVMCAYNRINGVYACENPDTLKRILKGQLGFDGFVMSDWGGTHSTVAAANNGLDMEMDVAPGRYFSQPLKDAVTAGQVPKRRLDDMVRRIARAMFRVGVFDAPPAAEPAAYGADVRRPQDVALARQISEDGTVLLKNDKGILPLAGQAKRIAVIGAPAGEHGAQLDYNGQGSGHVPSAGGKPDVVSPLQGITQRAQAQQDIVTYADGASRVDAIAAAATADVAIVFAGTVDSEGQDRSSMSLQSANCSLAGCVPQPTDQDGLISAVAGANPNTVVVLNTGGPVTMPWLGQVKGLFEAWYPGQEDGNAIAALLFGDVNPSGKLPQTFPASERDLPTTSVEQYPGVNDAQGVPHSRYSEGLLVGYRWYDARRIAPLFPFGYGLSYTSFDERNLKITASNPDATAATVSFDVANTGSRAGAEIPQVYVSNPASDGEPPRQLKGFTKLTLARGASRRVSLALDSRSFAHYAAGAWRVSQGCYEIAVGRSSRDLPLKATVSVGAASCPGAVAHLPLVTHLSNPGGKARCLSRRSILIHLFGVRRSQVRSVTVTLNGKRRRVLHGRHSAVRVNLRGMPKGRVRVRLLISLGHHRAALITRTYRTCTRARAHRLRGGRAKPVRR